MDLYAMVIFLFFVVVMTAIIGGFVTRARTAQAGKQRDSIQISELETRIKEAVRVANEPLRHEIKQLRMELDAIEPKRRKLEGGALSDPTLLT